MSFIICRKVLISLLRPAQADYFTNYQMFLTYRDLSYMTSQMKREGGTHFCDRGFRGVGKTPIFVTGGLELFYPIRQNNAKCSKNKKIAKLILVNVFVNP